MLVLGCYWILSMHGWFFPIRLIHPIGQKSLHFEKINSLCMNLYNVIQKYINWTFNKPPIFEKKI